MLRLVSRAYRYRAAMFVYLFIGGWSALVNWIVFYLFYTGLSWHYAWAAVAAFVVATAVNYVLSERVGFVSGDRSRAKLIIGVYVVSVAGFCVDLLALAVLFDLLHVNVMIAKVIGTAVAFAVNFVGRQFFVFVRQPRWTSLHGMLRRIARTPESERAPIDEKSLSKSEGQMEGGL